MLMLRAWGKLVSDNVGIGSLGCSGKVGECCGWDISADLTGGVITIVTIMLAMTSQGVIATQ